MTLSGNMISSYPERNHEENTAGEYFSYSVKGR
jgi:hypothetical protein